MKKYKSLFRCQLGGYAIWLFGVILAPLMFIKFSPIPVIILEVFAVLILAGEITAHVLFAKNQRKLYLPFSFASQGAAILMVLIGFIFEIALAINGEPAIYALIMFSVCLGLYLLIGAFVVINNIKVIKGTIDKSKFER